MFIPGWLISLVTFPGIIIHEFAHKKFCNWNGVVVNKVVYFRLGNPAGYVAHEEPKTFKQTFYISIGPLIINSIFAVVISFVSTFFLIGSSASYFFIWIALSIGMHSFPSDHDGGNILSSSKSSLDNGGSFLHFLSYPFYWLLWIANKLRFIWFDLFYAVFLVYIGGGLGY